MDPDDYMNGAGGDATTESLAHTDNEETHTGVLRDKTNDVIERKEAAKKNRRRKKTTASLVTSCFQDLYRLSGEVLGRGAYASVQTCVNILTDMEFAVKMIDKVPGHPRARVFREVETFHHCQGHPNIIQLLEMFEDDRRFYLVFEKVEGGQLLTRIQERGRFTEREAAEITRDLASALKFLHAKGIAHRDLKPENILCVSRTSLSPVKLCDLDLGSGIRFSPALGVPLSSPRLHSPVGSAEFMAPEVVATFTEQPDHQGSPAWYDKRCDMWSLGVVLYILLSGYPPFWGQCCNESSCLGPDCSDCRSALFDLIADRPRPEFPIEEWAGVSEAARRLVASLLSRDPADRPTAAEVLSHPWVSTLGAVGDARLLPTPHNITNTKSVSEMAESAMSLNRVLVQQLSLTTTPSTTANNQQQQCCNNTTTTTSGTTATNNNNNNNSVSTSTTTTTTATTVVVASTCGQQQQLLQAPELGPPQPGSLLARRLSRQTSSQHT
ncbi:MAP kinase-interacting serine/threonine-protein kinase 1-like isoform X3 [Rhodnius prolixus]|uniref:MAP kinase-interacting serine/threonine-protein kinase 1-like isoform X3 n=1 Tax=Rhodnius prolixus TaxID=13249 RepID=UPI003D187D40